MSIYLDVLQIPDDMYLEGIEQSQQVAYTQVRTIDGVPYVTAKPTPGGRTLTLGTVNINGAMQGFWCRSLVLAVKNLEVAAVPVVLDYHGDLYTVMVISTSDINQFEQNVQVNDNKAYIGRITLLEV